MKCVNFSDISVTDDEVVINSVGNSQEEAMALLGVVGLSEAFIMLRKYKELSEGQKYRYKLAKMISLQADAYLIDEFGATLDHEMAKVLAFCLQKWARKNNKKHQANDFLDVYAKGRKTLFAWILTSIEIETNRKPYSYSTGSWCVTVK